MTDEAPGQPGSPVQPKQRYDNVIGGHCVPPTTGEYRGSVTPATGEPFCEVAHSGEHDIELALNAAQQPTTTGVAARQLSGQPC